MRPDILFPLFAPVTSLSGVGPRLGKLFDRLVGSETDSGPLAKVADAMAMMKANQHFGKIVLTMN